MKDGKHLKPGSSIEVVPFDFNPKDYSTGMQANWNLEPQKKPGENPEYTGTKQRTLDLEVFLDATDADDGDVSPTIDALFSTMRPTEKSKGANTPCPPIVVFSWGSAPPFVGVVKSVTATLTLFRPSGQPVRATCKVSMQEYPTEPGKQNPTSGALRSSRAHRVVLGDTLASIANAEYGSPVLWRAIAVVNGLEDPFRLRLGRELLLPPPSEAAAFGLRTGMAAQRSSNVFEIKVDGNPVAPEVATALVEAYVEDEVNLPDAFELVFRDPLRTVLAAGKFEIGKRLTISVVSEADAAGHADLRRRGHGRRGRDRAGADARHRARVRSRPIACSAAPPPRPTSM